MQYFQAFLSQSNDEDANLISQWQQISQSLLQIEELKAKAYGLQSIPPINAEQPSILTPMRTNVKGSNMIDKRAPTSSLHQISQMSLEDAAWSLGCLLSSAKEVKQLIGDMSSPTWTTDKQTIDLLVLLERTEFVDESSFGSIMTLDPVFIHDVVATLESIFRVRHPR
jgi:TFIIF-interacting CTD phosphatase-like protein